MRPIGDGIGDEAGQNRHHQRKAGLGTDLEQGPAERALIGVLEHVDAAKGETDRDQQAAGNHEGIV